MTSVLDPAGLLPARLRRAHLRAEAEAEGAQPWQRIAWASARARTDPEAAIAGLEAEAAGPKAPPAVLHALLDLAIHHRGAAKIDALVSRIRATGRPPPFWVGRFLGLWETGRVSMGSVTLDLGRGIVEPAILKGFATAEYEAREAAIAADLLRDGDRVVELGAGVGYVAAHAMQGRNGIDWLAVEANRVLIPLIEETARLNGLSLGILHAACGAQEGEVALTLSARGFWAASLRDMHDATGTVRVPGIRGAELIRERAPDMLIMDIEGAEYAILAEADLSGIDRLLVEFHPAMSDDAEHTATLARLFAQGFLVDTARSMGDVMCLRRP